MVVGTFNQEMAFSFEALLESKDAAEVNKSNSFFASKHIEPYFHFFIFYEDSLKTILLILSEGVGFAARPDQS